MRIFFDTEFIENGKTIDLLSIGLVREDGAELYLENSEAAWARADEWVVENVLPKLEAWPKRGFPLVGGPPTQAFFGVSLERETYRELAAPPPDAGLKHWRTRVQIATEVRAFVGPDPTFWAYFADYDWVVLCQLYGRMIDLPDGWPMFCRDLKQEMVRTGVAKIRAAENAHNALYDARWNRDMYDVLTHRGVLP